MSAPTVFISYSHKDEEWKDSLRPHLKMLEQARASWAKAKEMIERMGYHRRDKDVQEIEEQLKKA